MNAGTAEPLASRGGKLDHAGTRLAAAIVLLAGTAAAPAVLADEGMVIWKNHDCGYFILQLKSGYAIYEWLAGPHPNDGDVLEGELKSAGEHRINNKTADLPTTVFLDTYSPNRAVIAPRIPARCKSQPGYIPFEGR
jgi:hypothetical protein